MAKEDVNQEQTLAEDKPAVEETPATTTEVEQPAALTPEQEARVEQLVANATAKAVDEAKETGRRELQSQQALNRNSDRRAKQAEAQTSAYESSFGNLDEETRKEIENAKVRGENQFYKSQSQEDEARRQQETYNIALSQSLRDEVAALGIDTTDTRIDYAADAANYFEGRKRFSDSLAKVVKSEKDNIEKTIVQKAEDRFKQLETDFRKEHNLDSQDTTTPSGVVNQSDAEFMADFGDNKIPASKENRARYDAIKVKHY